MITNLYIVIHILYGCLEEAWVYIYNPSTPCGIVAIVQPAAIQFG